MILSRKEILAEVKKGKLKLTPFKRENVGEVSVDLTLGNEFKILKKIVSGIVVTENAFNNDNWTNRKKLKKGEKITLKPGELILGVTEETITLPNYLCGWIQGRSRFARLGLLVHVSSGLIQPGVSNKQVLEIVNLSQSKLHLTPGLKVCQVIFNQISSPEKHTGVFSRQTTV